MALFTAALLLIAVCAGACCAYCLACAISAMPVRSWVDAAHRLRGRAASLVGRALSVGPVAKMRSERKQRAYRQALRDEMPEMLRLINIALGSGSSLVKAIDYAAKNCKDPLAEELEKCVWDLESGQGFDEAMARLNARTCVPEFGYLAAAFSIQHRSGGSLADVLAAATDSLKKVADLEETLKTQTAQGRTSARVIAAMPVVVLGLLTAITPSYLADFLASPFGVFMFLLALLLELAGIFLVRKVLAIDLSAGSLGRS